MPEEVTHSVQASRTQGERSAATRRRILDATVEALVERGYCGTTTLAVQERAGVSRGAVLHHYSSRTELMVAAVDHLCRERTAEVIALLRSAPPTRDRTSWAVRVLWGTFDGPLFTAALELWAAARNDPELLSVLLPQERVLGQSIRALSLDLFGLAATESPHLAEAIDVLLDAMRGAASRRMLMAAGAETRLLEAWTRLVERVAASNPPPVAGLSASEQLATGSAPLEPARSAFGE